MTLAIRILAILGLALALGDCSTGTGEIGTHRGVITDVSRAGWFCKTWEGQMISGGGQAAIHFDFTIADDATALKLQEAQRTGAEVIIHYESPILYSLCSSTHDTIVRSVEPYTGAR